MKAEVFKSIVERLEKLVKKHSFDRNCNFLHIANNLLQILDGNNIRCELFNEPWDGIEPQTKEPLRALIDYLKLLHSYPHYNEAEFSSEEGFFPDIPKDGDGIINYVFESERRLEQRN